MLRVHEIFSTIQGEGYDTGLPCTFIRLYGCSVGCSFCDQPQHINETKMMTILEVIEEVEKLGINYICLTGGEPLEQKDSMNLINELTSRGYKVTIETSGVVPLLDEDERDHKYVMDVKCISSGVYKKNYYPNLAILKETDEVKFVIADRFDYNFMKKILRDYPTKAKVLLSPMFDPDLKQHVGTDLCNWLVEDNKKERFSARIQLQIHKILGVC